MGHTWDTAGSIFRLRECLCGVTECLSLRGTIRKIDGGNLELLIQEQVRESGLDFYQYL
jgi:hypothetical protein